MLRKQAAVWAAVAIAVSGCAGRAGDEVGAGDSAARAASSASGLAGAAFTTWDVDRGGCLDGSTNGINCNHYRAKEDVFASGGPVTAALGDGRWTFTVLVPGAQNDVGEDVPGNLSDKTAFAPGDLGSGNPIACRTFSVLAGAIAAPEYVTKSCHHVLGKGVDGRPVIQLFPFDDTTNEDGVYILAICPEGGAKSGCRYDAFVIGTGEPEVDGGTGAPVNRDPEFSGLKYYDANANGQHDEGEVGIAGWLVDVGGDTAQGVTTGADGRFSLSLAPGAYTFAERLAPSPWMQSGNRLDQIATKGVTTATLLGDRTYTVQADVNATIGGIYFGNLCLGAGGGHGHGYWANEGNASITDGDLEGLAALNLRRQNGNDYDPPSRHALAAWLLDQRSPNMANMLSVQVTALWLSVQHGEVDPTALVYAPGASTGNAGGFLTVAALLAEADASLGTNAQCLAGDACRSPQEALKNDVQAVNGNQAFVQPGPESCPAPLFE